MTEVVPIFLRVDPRDIAMVKFLFESYEGVGIVRTLDRREAIVVALVVPDFLDVAREIVSWLEREATCVEVTAPPDVSGDWLLDALQGEPRGK